MPGRQKIEDELEFTAQPKSIPEELGTTPVHESGLSVEPEELGRQFLSDAIEQGSNFESRRGGDAAELWINAPASSDEPLLGPNFEVDRTVWENTVSLALQAGGPDGARNEISPARPDDDEEDESSRALDESGDIDLTELVIHDGSLLDHEADELGETVTPGVRTDDSHSHAKKRGGHAPKDTRHASRAR